MRKSSIIPLWFIYYLYCKLRILEKQDFSEGRCQMRKQTLLQMTPTQRKRANALIRSECCNFDGGYCLMLDDGESHACPQLASYSVLCKWFQTALLPTDAALRAEMFGTSSIKGCAICGEAFVPKSNRAKYCASCAAKIHRQQKNVSDRNRRALRTNRPSEPLVSQRVPMK